MSFFISLCGYISFSAKKIFSFKINNKFINTFRNEKISINLPFTVIFHFKNQHKKNNLLFCVIFASIKLRQHKIPQTIIVWMKKYFFIILSCFILCVNKVYRSLVEYHLKMTSQILPFKWQYESIRKNEKHKF